MGAFEVTEIGMGVGLLSQLYNSRLLCSHAVLEIVTVVISHGNFKCYISLFYHPPNSLVCVDNSFQEYLDIIMIFFICTSW